MISVLQMTEETFGQRLKRLRQARGLSKYRLAKTAPISESYVYQLENDKVKNPRRDTLLSLAKGLNTSLSELAGETPRSPESVLADLEVSIKAYIPVYAEVSAGEGMEPIDYVATTRAKAAPESLRAYRVKGLCLEPDIREGDTLIVDTELQPEPGNLVVVIIDDQASVKRFRGDYLENNEGKYRPEDVYLHGVVIEVNRKMR